MRNDIAAPELNWRARLLRRGEARGDRLFDHVVTLDPGLARDVWDRLSVDQRVVAQRELTLRLHEGLLAALGVQPGETDKERRGGRE